MAPVRGKRSGGNERRGRLTRVYRTRMTTDERTTGRRCMTSTFNAGGETILILDFGAQYTQLIARRVRECNVYCEIVPHDITLDVLRERGPRGLILSGGPS